MKLILLLAGVAVILGLLAVVRAIRRNAGVPTLDDPEQVTPPLAREMSQNERRREHL